MIYRHKFLKEPFIKDNQTKQITKEEPLVVILERDQFLHYTIEKSLKYLNIPHQITTLSTNNLEEKRKIMEHQVPTLIYSDEVLQSSQLMQFLCDAFLDDHELIDFESRKAMIKDLAKTWKQIFLFERFYPYSFGKLRNLGVANKRDYQHLILQQLRVLSINFQGKIIKRAFNGYSEQIPTLESILFVDIITSIIKRAPQSFIDYTLRSHFMPLIELKNNLQRMIEAAHPKNEADQHHFVILEEPIQPQAEYQNFALNVKRFCVAFGVVGAIYGIFVKA